MRRAHLIEDLQTLIGFPTVSTSPVTAIAAFMSERFEALGFNIEHFDDPHHPGKTNVICSAGPIDATGGLVLSGHMDVVPTEGQPWTGDPFKLRTTDTGRLIGRGTADMKGFLAACLSGLESLQVDRLRAPLVLVWTHDEEVGCHGSAHLAKTFEHLNRRLPSACWIGEPTGFEVLRKHAGHVGVEVRLQGQAAHSAYTELGANAVVASARVVGALDDLSRQWALRQGPEAEIGTDRPRGIPLNVANIHGGNAINIVPDRCVLQLGFRPLPRMGHSALVEELQATLDDVRLPDGTRLESEVLRVTPSLLTREGTHLQTLLLEHAASQQLGTAGYATDGGNLQSIGCEPLIFGPGSIQVAHQADEHVTVEALEQAVDQVRSVVNACCSID
ncbi:MAG TPA: acetylornithine deacetylase [Myxococcales bacterium]|nr:acetylornithine deacetylase [Myxococcales bacterium]